MTSIAVTLILDVRIVGDYDEGEPNFYFVVRGLPRRVVGVFWKKIDTTRDFYRESEQPKRGLSNRLRVGWCYDESAGGQDSDTARKKLSLIIRKLVGPNAMIRHRTLNRAGWDTPDEYSDDEEMALLGGFTDEERLLIPKEERAAMIGIQPK